MRKDPRVGGGDEGTGKVTKNPTPHSPSDFGSSYVANFGSSYAVSFGSSYAASFGSSYVANFGSSDVASFGSNYVASFGSSYVANFGSSYVASFGSSDVASFGSSYVAKFGSSYVARLWLKLCSKLWLKLCSKTLAQSSNQLSCPFHEVGINWGDNGSFENKYKKNKVLLDINAYDRLKLYQYTCNKKVTGDSIERIRELRNVKTNICIGHIWHNPIPISIDVLTNFHKFKVNPVPSMILESLLSFPRFQEKGSQKLELGFSPRLEGGLCILPDSRPSEPFSPGRERQSYKSEKGDLETLIFIFFLPISLPTVAPPKWTIFPPLSLKTNQNLPLASW
ncbi:hypothetical protein Lal_00031982 [Lupinus albus]|nr:hypothetical protein Lal_00031982 [Lupinus albus]